MTDALPLLYSFRRCPYAMRARLALTVASHRWVHREVDLQDRPAELYAASAKGTVPVLVLAKGAVIDESLEVMRWALAERDPLRWLPEDAQEELAIDELLAACDGPFKHHLDRYKYGSRHPEEDPAEHREQASAILMEWNARLAKHGHLIRGQACLADMALFPFVRQFAFADRSWFDGQAWPKLIAWLDELTSSELFEVVMTKRVPWKAGDTALILGGED